MNSLKLGVGVILVVIGALLLADRVIGWVKKAKNKLKTKSFMSMRN